MKKGIFCIYSIGKGGSKEKNKLAVEIARELGYFSDELYKEYKKNPDKYTIPKWVLSLVRIAATLYINRLIDIKTIKPNKEGLASAVDEYLKNIENEDLQKAIVDFMKERQTIKDKQLNDLGTYFSEDFTELRISLPALLRLDAVAYLSYLFMAELDELSDTLDVSRELILKKGYKDGDKVISHITIFNRLRNLLAAETNKMVVNYNRIYGNYERLKTKMKEGKGLSDTEKAAMKYVEETFIKTGIQLELMDKIEAYKLIISNIRPLLTLTKAKLFVMEGVKMGNTNSKAKSARDIEFVSEEEIQELFGDLYEESTKERWMDILELISAFVSAHPAVRRILCTIPIYNKEAKSQKGGLETTVFGSYRYKDPLTALRELLYAFRGMKDSKDMLEKLRNYYYGHPNYKDLYNLLANNNVLRTQFFVSLKKNQILYSLLLVSLKSSVKIGKNVILNTISDSYSYAYADIIKNPKEYTLPEGSIYNKDGTVNKDKLTELINILTNKKDLEALTHAKNESNEDTIRESIKKIFTLLGIDGLVETGDTSSLYEDLVSDRRTRAKLIRELKGIGWFLRSKLDTVERGTKGTLLYNSKDNRNQPEFKKRMKKVFELITLITEGKTIESLVKYKNSKGKSVTLFTDIYPSFMGELLEKLLTYIAANNKEGLKKFMRDNFFKSSMFYISEVGSTEINVDNIVCPILRDLYKACISNENINLTAYSDAFNLLRAIGSPNLEFENFTEKLHLLDFIDKFTSDTEDGIINSAVFILGDSGLIKYISYPVKSFDLCVDDLYLVYLSEKQRMILLYKAAKKGIIIKNFSDKTKLGKPRVTYDGKVYKGKFELLDFLNLEEYKPASESKGDVTSAIRKYLEDRAKALKSELEKNGLLDTVTLTKKVNGNDVVETSYKYFTNKQILDGDSKFDVENNDDNVLSRLEDITANQVTMLVSLMQITTSSTAFYPNIKDLQKRYKETHASGTPLDLAATDFEGNPVCPDGKLNVIYISDIKTDAEETSKGFFKMITSIFEGKPKVVEKYKENTLTDGQGWRTLKSHRDIRLMLGDWTVDDENAYNKIKELKDFIRLHRNITDSEEKKEYLKELLQKKQELMDLAGRFSSIKPFGFFMEEVKVENSILYVPVLHKYAEAVVIPELLLDGSMLLDLAYYMEDNNIDAVLSVEAVKVGVFGLANISEIKNKDDLKTALGSATTHSLSYEGWVKQTNTPLHAYSERLYGTLIRKLTLAGVKTESTHYDSYFSPEANLGTYIEDNSKGIKITDNYNADTRDGKLTGRGLMLFYNGLVCVNMAESMLEFTDRIKDPKDLANLLILNALNTSKSTDEFIASLGVKLVGEKDGTPIYEFNHLLYDPTIEHEASALFLSIFKNMVNKLKITGSSAVLVSSMGISGYELLGDLECEVVNNNVICAEVEIPWDLSYTDKSGKTVKLKFSDYCYANGELKMSENDKTISKLEEEFPGILNMVAYRIPTEGLYSTIHCKVKRFTTEVDGGIIRVPHMFTTIAGFDFDIDKLYIMRKEFNNYEDANNYDKYDFTLSILNNSRAARNNMLLHITQLRLMDEETRELRYTPGAFANASEAARYLREILYGEMDEEGKEFILSSAGNKYVVNSEHLANIKNAANTREDPEPPFYLSDFLTILKYNQRNLIAGKLIGIFANLNVNHALVSLLDSCKLVDKKSGSPITVGLNNESKSDLKTDGTAKLLAELLSASVDAVKDPVLNYLNLDPITANLACLLVRLGYNFKELGLLFNLPIIKEILLEVTNNNKSITLAIKDTFNKYFPNVNENALYQYNETSKVTTEENLTRCLLLHRKNSSSLRVDNNLTSDFMKILMQVLVLFNLLTEISNDLDTLIYNTKLTSQNSLGSTFGDYIYTIDKIKESELKYIEIKNNNTTLPPSVLNIEKPEKKEGLDVKDRVLSRLDEIVQSPFAYELTMFDTMLIMIEELGEYFPYMNTDYEVARLGLRDYFRYRLSVNTINSINRDFLTYAVSLSDTSDLNGNLPYELTLGDRTVYVGSGYRRAYFNKRFAEDFGRFLLDSKNKKLVDNNGLLSKLLIVESYDEDNKLVPLIMLKNINSDNSTAKNDAMAGWAELAESEDQMHRDIAKALYLYCFFNQGFRYNFNTFLTCAPEEVLNTVTIDSTADARTTYLDFLRIHLATRGSHLNSVLELPFRVAYALNHMDDYNLCLSIDYDSKLSSNTNTVAAYINKKVNEHKNLEEGTTIEIEATNTIFKNSPANQRLLFTVVKEGDKSVYLFKPIIKVGNNIFLAYGEDGKPGSRGNNRSTAGSMKYKLIAFPTDAGVVYESAPTYYTDNLLRDNLVYTLDGREIEISDTKVEGETGSYTGDGDTLNIDRFTLDNIDGIPVDRIGDSVIDSIVEIVFNDDLKKRAGGKSFTGSVDEVTILSGREWLKSQGTVKDFIRTFLDEYKETPKVVMGEDGKYEILCK